MQRASPPSLSLLVLSLLTATALAQPQPIDPCPTSGSVWETAFDHDPTGFAFPPTGGFNAIHMGLIPAGPHQGKVVVLDRDFNQPSTGRWHQRWSIVDSAVPGSPAFINGEIFLAEGQGDLFCAGHAWDADGRWLLAGGTTRYPDQTTGQTWAGGNLALYFDPSQPLGSAFYPHPDLLLNTPRWYPTVSMLGDGSMYVYGGTQFTGNNQAGLLDDFEFFDGSQWVVAPGPGLAPKAEWLGLYPRMHLLRDGQVFCGAHTQRSYRLSVPSHTWQIMGQTSQTTRGGCSVLFPNVGVFEDHDVVMVIGGKQGSLVTDEVQYCNAVATSSGAYPNGWDWTTWQPMHEARWRANATILPDASVFVVGGDRNPDPMFPNPVMTPELFTIQEDGTNDTWTQLPDQTGPRTYHSTAVLLPSGKVLVGGGDTRTVDYQVFVPPYLTCNQPRPEITFLAPAISYGAQGVVRHAALPQGRSISKVVFIRPGSTTHHSDYDQRYKSLEITASGATAAAFTMPTDANELPPGYYMVFLISDQNIPSTARFVRVQ